MEEIKKKKSNKGLVAIIIILLIAFLGAIGYICYDKGVFDNLLNKEKSVPIEEPKQEEKLSEEEVKELYNKFVSNSIYGGFHFNRKVSVEEMPASIMLRYAFNMYLNDNNVTYDDNYITVCGENSYEYYICY